MPTYWLVNTGTVEDPWRSRIATRYREWNEDHGDVQMFPVRPASMAIGDILIHRAVGDPMERLLAVGEVVSSPHPSGAERWPWQVERRLLHVCELAAAPVSSSAGFACQGLRVMKRLTPEQGARAAEAIARLGQPWR